MLKNKQQEIKSEKLEKTLSVKEKDVPKKEEKIEMVEGIFRNWDIKGAPHTFSYFTKTLCGKNGAAKKYTFEDGGKYTIPLEVAKHLNQCSFPVSKHEVDKQGKHIGKVESRVHRFSFRRINDLM